MVFSHVWCGVGGATAPSSRLRAIVGVVGRRGGCGGAAERLVFRNPADGPESVARATGCHTCSLLSGMMYRSNEDG